MAHVKAIVIILLESLFGTKTGDDYFECLYILSRLANPVQLCDYEFFTGNIIVSTELITNMPGLYVAKYVASLDRPPCNTKSLLCALVTHPTIN